MPTCNPWVNQRTFLTLKSKVDGNGSRKERTLKVYRQPKSETLRPEIRLSGNWLNRMGFEIGDYIRVVCKQNEILIMKIGGFFNHNEE